MPLRSVRVLHFDGTFRARNTRVASAIATVGVHIGLFSFLLFPNHPEQQTIQPSLRIFNVSAISANAKPEHPKAPQPIRDKPTPPQPIVAPPPELVLPTVSTLLVATVEQT